MDLSSWSGTGGVSGLQVLWEDGERIFCRGERQADGQQAAVLAMLPAAERPTPAILDRLAREYELKDELTGAWVVQPLALVRERGRIMLVLEDTGSEPLHRLLGPPMEVRCFLRLAVAITAALAQVHRRSLVHKDIKPANILVNRTTGEVKLTGFGIASRLPRERQAPAPPESIAGTLAYMAPEQTGRMNRSIDARSDLYALGVTFYQMLTGSLPFAATDPMEWVHCHIARRPAPPSERLATIPAALSNLVLKLLAKTAEERYQTAAGLERDLRRCLAEWEAQQRIDVFPLGQHDAPDRLVIPEKLYGREREIGTLLAAFDRVVAGGTPELVLVTGYSGIGKSAVVNELHKALVPPRGLFASGKFDQYKRDIPYATLAQAFQGLIRALLGKSDSELSAWRDALLEALGPNGRLLVDLIPELKLVIGEQPPVAELEPQQAQGRFQLVLRRFVSVFAQPEHPLALFLDDLQWLDAATLDLLEHLVTHSEVRHLLLVGAYRDNEVSPSHPLLRTLDAIRNAGARVEAIVLSPLGLDDVGQLVADAMHCEPERVQPVAQLVQEKTGGNPFFAIQFFTALAEEGLLTFEPIMRAWQWNMDRMRARSFTDNVVDFMTEKLKRFSSTTQEALKQLACLSNVVPTANLALVQGSTEEAMHTALWEAVHAGLVFREDSTYKFLHDRIQQAAYSLIPVEQRAGVHLGIGRVLLANLAADRLAEHLFDIANHFNRGTTLLIDRDEKAQVATIGLRAGRKAKASAAYVSACAYFAAGMALLDEKDWGSQYDLTFSLWLERAECEFLSGNFDKAEQLILELLQRGASKVDLAAVYYVKILLHVRKSENPKAVDGALTCLRLFDIDLPAHPTWEHVQAEDEMLWRNLDGRPIEGLIDMPLMTDPELQAAMQVLSVLNPSAYFTDFRLCCLQTCRMVNISLQHGVSNASASGYASFGVNLGAAFHRYREGYRFAKLACDLVEKHGLIADQAKVYVATARAAFWTQPIASTIDFMRKGLRAAIETGDLTMACFGIYQSVSDLLLRNDPLDAVWRESERGLDFVQKAKFRDAADIMRSQQRFIATMQGRTTTFSTFSDAQFDEAAFEVQLTADSTALKICLYWILKLKARFLSGDYAEALASADKAKALIWAAIGRPQLLDYFYYTALTAAALYDDATADEPDSLRELLTAHREQLREWAENNPPTFGDKHALVSAEIARIEGRDLDAMRLYEQAIRAARENGFVQNEALGYELAARFYAARGFEKIARVYLRDARYGYVHWGADGKVRQLDELYPRLREQEPTPVPTSTIGTLVEHLDLATVIKVSQAISSEIVLETLIDTLMRTAIEQAGAERGLLILSRGAEPRIEAEATTGVGTVVVQLCDQAVTASVLPEAVFNYVLRTRETVILDDAAQSAFGDDPYLGQHQARSVLCLPLITQAKLIGALYLENTLTTGVFAPNRSAVLKLLASQAAIALEIAHLYRDLEQRESKIRRLVDANIIGIYLWELEGRIIEANDTFLRMVGFDREDLVSGRMRWTDLPPPEWRDRSAQGVEGLRMAGRMPPVEREFLRKNGSRVPVLLGSALFDEQRDQGVSFVLDLSEQKRTEAEARESERHVREMQMEVAHANRVATMGQLTASIAHEVNQPIAAAVTNAQAALRWLAARPPDLEEVHQALDDIVKDANRAGDVIGRIREIVKKAPPRKEPVDMNEAIREVIELTHGEATKHGASVQTVLGRDLPAIEGDRVQLQQVVLNLIVNAVQAMGSVAEGPRELLITTARAEPDGVLVTVKDSGPGLAPASLERLFDPFYTTKPEGLGMGLSICRSIIEAHGGRLWVTANQPRGAILNFTMPTRPDSES